MQNEATAMLPVVVKEFAVLTVNLGKLREKLETLNRRAAKLGVEPVTLTIGEDFIKDVDIGGIVYHYPMTLVQVTGKTPRLNGWCFVATLQHLDTEEGLRNVIRTVPGLELSIPERFHTTDAVCEHCNSIRRRKDTYVLFNADAGEWKQVGSSCLGDFVGSDKVANALAAAQFLQEVAELSEAGYGDVSGRGALLLQDVIEATCAVVRVDGAFVSKTKAQETMVTATATTVNDMLDARYMHSESLRKTYALTDEDRERAAAMISWARENLPAMAAEETGSTYLYNLDVVMHLQYLKPRLLGIACSLIACYDRAMGKKAEREALVESKHFGTEGERIKMLGVKLVGLYTSEGMYGTTFIHKFITDDGNVAVWFASSRLESDDPEKARIGVKTEVGEHVFIAGTVKRHDVRDGVKQTILTRCVAWTTLGVELEMAKQAKKAARAAKKAAKDGQ